jgi:hypothetical protein
LAVRRDREKMPANSPLGRGKRRQALGGFGVENEPAPSLRDRRRYATAVAARHPWSCEKIKSGQSWPTRVLYPQPKTHAERAFHLGGAGAPASTSCRKDPMLNLFTTPLQGGNFLEACKLRLPFHHMVGEFGKEPGGFAHWRQSLLGFLHLPMGVATGLIEAQKFGERYFVV